MARTGQKVREQLEFHLKRAAEARKTGVERVYRPPKPTRVYVAHVGHEGYKIRPDDVIGVTIVESNGWVADVKLIQRTMEQAYPGKTARFIHLL